MKIGLVCPYNMFRGGGVPECVMAMYDELRRRGHEVRVITPRPRGFKGSLPQDMICIGGARSFNRLFSTQGQLAAAVDTEVIDKFLAAEKFDLLHFHEPWVPMLGWQLLSRSQCVNVGTFHAKIPDQFTTKTIIRSLIPYGRSVIKYLHGFSAVSPSAAELVEALLDESVPIIPNGVNIAKFSPAKTVKTEHSHKTILFVGRLEKRKGVRYLLDAFQVLAAARDDVKLVIGGDGPERRRLEDHVEEYEIPRVEFRGFLSEKDKIKLLQNADVFCAPSRYGESFGIVLLEAMAAGTPVIAGDNPGYESVLHERGALSLVNPLDANDFARRLDLMLYDREMAQLWLKWSRDYVKQFDYKNIVDQYEKLYESAIKTYPNVKQLTT